MLSRSVSIQQKSNAEVGVKQGDLSKGMGKRNLTWLACILASGLIMRAPSQAALLNLESSNPDLSSFHIGASLTVAYNASSGAFTANGDTESYFPADTTLNDGQPYAVSNDGGFNPGTFNLAATIATDGTLLNGGTMSITGGTYDDQGYQVIPDGTVLLQGDLVGFGFQGFATGPDYFDFKVAVTGGELANEFGSSAYIYMEPGSTSFNNDFTVGFSNDGEGTADTRMLIPEPTSGLLVMLSLLGLGGVVRRVRRK